MRRMCLEVKKGGIDVTASGAITGGMHLTVTMVAVILQMTRSDPAGRGGTAGQKAVGPMRMSDMTIGEQSDLGRRTGTARGAKEEH